MRIRRFFPILAIGFFSLSGWSSSTMELNVNPLKVQLSVDPKEVQPSQGANIHLKLRLDRGYHAYLDQFKVTISPDEVKLGKFEVKPVVKFFDKFSKKDREGIQVEAEMILPFEAPEKWNPDLEDWVFELRYQACNEKFCLLPKTIKIPWKWQKKVATNDMPVGSATLASATDESLSNQITTRLAQSLSGESHLWALLIAFVAGILSCLTPCVFPLIPITLSIFGAKDAKTSRGKSFLLSATYVGGIAVMYSSLGVIAAKSGALFGSFLGHPVVIAVIVGIFVMMALSMFGLFEVAAPTSVQSAVGKMNIQPGYGGAFVSGLFAGVVASPCVGPVLVALLTYVAQTGQVLWGMTLLFVYALGFGQLFLALGTFSSLAQKLPRSGPWMVEVKRVFGFVMIALAIYYVRPLLKVGYAELWYGVLGVLAVVLLILQWRAMKKRRSIPAIIATTFIYAVTTLGIGHWVVPETPAATATSMWNVYSAKLVEDAKASGKKVILDFWAQWCEACHELDEKTFSHPTVRKASEDILWVKYDATEISPEFEELQKKFEILGLPTTVFLDSKGQWVKELTLTGFEGPDPFLKRLEKFKSQ